MKFPDRLRSEVRFCLDGARCRINAVAIAASRHIITVPPPGGQR